MTVSEMLSKMDSQEVTEWMAYFEIENEKAKRAKDGPPLEEQMKAGMRGHGKMVIR